MPQPAPSQQGNRSGLRPATAPAAREKDLLDRFASGLKTVSEVQQQGPSSKRRGFRLDEGVIRTQQVL